MDGVTSPAERRTPRIMKSIAPLALLLTALVACSTPAPRATDSSGPPPPVQAQVATSTTAAPEGAIHLVEHPAEACALCDVYEHVRDATFVVRTPAGIGSAVLVRADGLAVTNAHVVGGEAQVALLRHDGTQLVGIVRAKDVREDLALLEIEALPEGLRPVELNALAPQVGSEVYAIGHPLGLGWTISRGIISGLPILNGRPMVQTDAPISPGNSGGPLVDEHGHLVGIVTEKIADRVAENLAFARPTGTVGRFLLAQGLELWPPAPSRAPRVPE